MQEDTSSRLRKESRFIKSYKYKHKLKRMLHEKSPIFYSKKFKSCDIEISRKCAENQIKDTSIKEVGSINGWLNEIFPSSCMVGRKLATSTQTQIEPSKVENLTRERISKLVSFSLPSKGSILYLKWLIMITLLLLSQMATSTIEAFCPFKCLCDDQSLSANCTKVPSITIIPMTFNPQLKQLTLNHVPMSELSNSLSVYRQLEYLNLNSNLLRQIKYQNFNFKPAPTSVLLISSPHLSPNSVVGPQLANGIGGKVTGQTQPFPSSMAAAAAKVLQATDSRPNLNQFELTNSHNEQLARHLKLSIDKSVSGSSQISSSIATSSSNSNDDQIGLHLRDLDLGDNRIDQLGSFDSDDFGLGGQEDIGGGGGGGGGGEEQVTGQHLRLKSSQLERFAPFLTLTKLENLNLSGNKLARIYQHAFLGLVNLKRLDLSRNQLEFIDRHAFVGLIALEWLKLNQNKLASHLSTLSVAFCRAPMIELRFLDLGHNQKSGLKAIEQQQQQDFGDVLLPNQMFVCSPKLVSLKLDNLQLRYIQVNAFDNLQQLETLNLSQNYLDQVPSDPLSYSNSNLSLSLRQLDLSDNLIEFVNARSFNSLVNLQKLCMNSMPRLMSFDLFSLPVRYHQIVGQSLEDFNGQLETIGNGQGIGSRRMNEVQLINEQLIELQLKQNPRLQSLHSSLAVSNEQPRGRIRFSKLRLLDLQEALELRDFPLDQMIEFGWSSGEENVDTNSGLQVDLSQVTKLNCSSCQMSWLVEAAKEQKQQQLSQSHHITNQLPFMQETLNQQASGWAHIPFETHSSSSSSLGSPLRGGRRRRRIHLKSGETVGCTWPFAMPLMQLIDLETSYAPILPSNCVFDENELTAAQIAAAASSSSRGADFLEQVNAQVEQVNVANNSAYQHHQAQQQQQPPHLATQSLRAKAKSEANSVGSFSGSLALASLLALVLLCVGVKLALVLASRWRPILRREFKWRSPSLTPSSLIIDSPGSSSTTQNHTTTTNSAQLLVNGKSMLYGQQPQLSHHQQQLTEAVFRPNDTAAKQYLVRLENQSGDLFCGGGGDGSGNQTEMIFESSYLGKVQSGEFGFGTPLESCNPSRGGNLFSRIVERLSGASWRPSPFALAARGGSGPHGAASAAGCGSSGAVTVLLRGGVGQEKLSPGFLGSGDARLGVIEDVVYGGCGKTNSKISAKTIGQDNNSTLAKRKAQFVSRCPIQRICANLEQDSVGETADFIKPAYCRSQDFEVRQLNEKVYDELTCYQEQQQTQEAIDQSSQNGKFGVNQQQHFGGRLVYANCRQEEASSEFGPNWSLNQEESTSCESQKQMLLSSPTKQLQAIGAQNSCGLPLRRGSPALCLAAAPQPTANQRVPSLSSESSHESARQFIQTNPRTLTTTCLKSGLNHHHRQQRPQLRCDEDSPEFVGQKLLLSHSAGEPACKPPNSIQQPNYLSNSAALPSSSSVLVANNSVARQSQLSKVSSEELGEGREQILNGQIAVDMEKEKEEAILTDGHIYVTLDRPIKQQNGCDEYENCKRPQQQQQQKEKHFRISYVEPKSSFLEAPLASSSSNSDSNSSGQKAEESLGEKGTNWKGHHREGDEEEFSKSFEWFTQRNSEEEKENFKLAIQTGSAVWTKAAERENSERQLAFGQLGGKLSSSSSPLKPLESSRQNPLELSISEAPNGRNHEAGMSNVDREAIKMYDKNDNSSDLSFQGATAAAAATQLNSRVPANRKSKRSSQRWRKPLATGSEGQEDLRVEGNVTGHCDYHDDDDDDVGGCIGQWTSQNGDSPLSEGPFRQQHLSLCSEDSNADQQQPNGQLTHTNRRQLFMGSNRSSPPNGTTNELTGMANSDSKGSPKETLERSTTSNRPTALGLAAKYDANHGFGPTELGLIQEQRRTATNNARGHTTREGGSQKRRVAPSDNYNRCVINGLQSKQHEISNSNFSPSNGKASGYLNNCTEGVVLGDPKCAGHNNNNSSNSNNNAQQQYSSNIANASVNSSPPIMKQLEAVSSSMVLINQRDFVVVAANNNNNNNRTVSRTQRGFFSESRPEASAKDSDYLCGQQKVVSGSSDMSIEKTNQKSGEGSRLNPVGSFVNSKQPIIWFNSKGDSFQQQNPLSKLSQLSEEQTKEANSSSNSSSSSSNVSNSNEIYSNQFYYCKPSTTTAAATLTRNKRRAFDERSEFAAAETNQR